MIARLTRTAALTGMIALGGIGIVGAMAPIALARAAAAEAKTYEIDASHSAVVFKIKHVGVAYSHGRFNDFAGSFKLDSANPSGSSLMVTVKAASIDTANEKRDQHLRSPDFFNTAQFPEITFKGTQFAAMEGGFKVTGDMTMKGVTKSITVDLKHIGTADTKFGPRSGYETTFTIKRADYGINYMPEGLGDEVTLTISLEGMIKS